MIDKETPISLDQLEIEAWFRLSHGNETWTILYQSSELATTGITLYSCLISPEQVPQSLATTNWNLMIGQGRPGFSQFHDENGINTEYHRIFDQDGEPLVIVRSFSNGQPPYVEISEELRLLFDLYEDKRSGSFLEIRDDGSEREVIRTSLEMVAIRTSLLRRYLAARQMVLVLQIESDVWVTIDGDVPKPQLPSERSISSENLKLDFHSGDSSFTERRFSRLLGKKFVEPSNRNASGIWPFEAEEEYLDFIIGEDIDGRPIKYTYNPEHLANYFGKNPEAPHYLTPIFFDREVLRKYYDNSDKCLVTDGSIQFQGLWMLRIDNDHHDHVMVFLGDLGRDIPQSERLHWRAYNILVEEQKMSGTAWQRAMLGEFATAESPEHQFKILYESISQRWSKVFGWPIFLELHKNDQHVLSSLRMPLSENTGEFDRQILSLAKLVVDSLNEAKIEEDLNSPHQRGERGIAKLARFFQEQQYPQGDRDIELLRTVQGLRSKGAAHRKGSDYDLTKAGLDPQNLKDGFRSLLERAVQMLSDLETFAASKIL